MHLPPLTHTFLHLYSVCFICTHFPSFVLTSLYLYSLTFTLAPYIWARMTFLPYMWATMTFWPVGEFHPLCIYYCRCAMAKSEKCPIFFRPPRRGKDLTASEFFRKAAIVDQMHGQQTKMSNFNLYSCLHAYSLWVLLVPWSMSWQYVTFCPSFPKDFM